MKDAPQHEPRLYVAVTLILVGGVVGAITGHWIGSVFAVCGFATLWWEPIQEFIDYVAKSVKEK